MFKYDKIGGIESLLSLSRVQRGNRENDLLIWNKFRSDNGKFPDVLEVCDF